MAKWCNFFFENMVNWGNIIGITKIEICQGSKTFHIEEWWIVENGPIQQNAKMFNNYKSTYGDDITTCKTIKKSFCNWNHVEEDIGWEILMANYV